MLKQLDPPYKPQQLQAALEGIELGAFGVDALRLGVTAVSWFHHKTLPSTHAPRETCLPQNDLMHPRVYLKNVSAAKRAHASARVSHGFITKHCRVHIPPVSYHNRLVLEIRGGIIVHNTCIS